MVPMFLGDDPMSDADHFCGEVDRLKAINAEGVTRPSVPGGYKLPGTAIIARLLPLRHGDSDDDFLCLGIADAGREPSLGDYRSD